MSQADKHVINERESNSRGYQVSYCGVSIHHEWAFTNSEHALRAVQAGSRLRPCEKCKDTIILLLNQQMVSDLKKLTLPILKDQR